MADGAREYYGNERVSFQGKLRICRFMPCDGFVRIGGTWTIH